MENTALCFELLQSLNVCPRCILRFCCEKDYKSYSKERLQNTLRKLVKSDPPLDGPKDDLETKNIVLMECEPLPKHHRPSLCCTCLGILQDSCDTMTNTIEMAIKSSGFQFSDFTIQLSLPVTTDLRQRLMFVHINDSLDSYKVTYEDIPSVKDVWKWVVGSQLSNSVESEFNPYSDFQILVTILHPDLASECSALFKIVPEAFPKRKKKKVEFEEIFTRAAVSNALNLLPEKHLKSLYDLPPVSPDKLCIYKDVSFTHTPLYLGGRYNKYSRELSQTPWILDGERKMESSVQEYITDCVERKVISDRIVFSASGREDVDVKMLGDGRPFILEIINPRCSKWTTEQMKDIEDAINSSTNNVFIRDLQVISKNDLHYIKLGEECKRKIYSALCIVKKVLTDCDIEKLKLVSNLDIQQTTPIRVLHRRPFATRKKIIHRIEGKIVSPHEIKLLIETQAGTYIKEFVNGDFGRTIPSLGILLDTEADILELDVLAIQLDWPPNKSMLSRNLSCGKLV